jgi:RNA-directed DNA polymerase
MKVSEVLVKVFEPGRLLMAWQQVRKNAGAAGIDQMTVEEFAQREPLHRQHDRGADPPPL